MPQAWFVLRDDVNANAESPLGQEPPASDRAGATGLYEMRPSETYALINRSGLKDRRNSLVKPAPRLGLEGADRFQHLEQWITDKLCLTFRC